MLKAPTAGYTLIRASGPLFGGITFAPASAAMSTLQMIQACTGQRWLLAVALLSATSCAFWRGQPDARQLLLRRDFSWVQDTSEHFILYLERGSTVAGRSDLLAFQLDRARERALALLGEKEFPTRINVFAVSTRERMEHLVGRSIDGIAFHRTNVIALVVADSVAGSPAHEVFHVIALNVWGPGPVWLNEAMAVDATGSWQDRDVHVRARELRAIDRLAPLDQLTRGFRSLDPRVAYPQAGSLVRYLREHYNPAALHALWRGEDEEFTRLVGIDLPAVERLWRQWLAR